MEKTAKCGHCGKQRKITAQGLCCSCYHRERRKRLGHSLSDTRGQEDFTVAVDFSPMAFLLEELKKRAGSELRDVGRQILWELNKCVGAGTC